MSQMTEQTTQTVRNQYEEFPYPPKNPEDEKTHFSVPATDILSAISYYCYGAKRDLRQGCRFLVAGGGTGDSVVALAEQLRDYDAEIVYLDLSLNSQKVARECVRVRGLEERVTWVQGSLLDLEKLGLGTFDYINCSGVLHHLKDPEQGLTSLVNALRPNGALGLMLYAKYGRLGVYQLQEALRLVNHRTKDPQRRVDQAKNLLTSIPGSNWFLRSPQVMLDELRGGDAGIYDLLLHSQDRAYSVAETYAFVRSAGLEIPYFFADNSAFGKKQYEAKTYIKDATLLKQVARLSEEESQQLAEVMSGAICKHTFYAVRESITPASVMDLEMVPFLDDVFSPRIYEELYYLVKSSKDVVKMVSENTNMEISFSKTPNIHLFMEHFDGQRTIGELVALVQESGSQMDVASLLEEFSSFFEALREYDWIFLRHKSIPAYTYRSEMRDRVAKMYRS